MKTKTALTPFVALLLLAAAVPSRAAVTSVAELRATAPEGAYVRVPTVLGRAVAPDAGVVQTAGGFMEPGIHQVRSAPFASAAEARVALTQRRASMEAHGFFILHDDVRSDGTQAYYTIDWILPARLGASARQGEARLIPAADRGDHDVQRYAYPEDFESEAAAAAEYRAFAARVNAGGFVVFAHGFYSDGYGRWHFWADVAFGR